MTNFVPIRSAAYIYKVFGKNLPIYDKIFEKPHNKSQGKNFTSIILPLNDFGGKKSFDTPSTMVPKNHKKA